MNSCDLLVSEIISGMERGNAGSVREAVHTHVQNCNVCSEHRDKWTLLAAGLDPAPVKTSPGFTARVMEEIRGLPSPTDAAYDRLPPLWQVVGAAVLFTVLAAVVLATEPTDAAWHSKALTGFLEQALSFLGGLSQSIKGLWDSVAPGRGLPALVGCALVATALNVAFAIRHVRRQSVSDTN